MPRLHTAVNWNTFFLFMAPWKPKHGVNSHIKMHYFSSFKRVSGGVEFGVLT